MNVSNTDVFFYTLARRKCTIVTNKNLRKNHRQKLCVTLPQKKYPTTLVNSMLADRSRGQPECSLFNSDSIVVYGRELLFPGLLHFTLDPYLIMLSVVQGGIKEFLV